MAEPVSAALAALLKPFSHLPSDWLEAVIGGAHASFITPDLAHALLQARKLTH